MGRSLPFNERIDEVVQQVAVVLALVDAVGLVDGEHGARALAVGSIGWPTEASRWR